MNPVYRNALAAFLVVYRTASAAFLVVGFAWRSLVRQPARASLGVLGVAAVGALLFDMLLLSEGLVLSMRDLLDRTGWDVRAGLSGDPPAVDRSPGLADVPRTLADLSALPSVRAVIAVRFAEASADGPAGESIAVILQGISDTSRVPWTLMRGGDATGADQVVVNQALADALRIGPGASVTLRVSCGSGTQSLPPVRFMVTGIAQFPFEEPDEAAAAGSLASIANACGVADDRAHMLLVASSGDAAATAAAIRHARPDLTASTNEDLVVRLQQTGFTYFRQISTVLTTVTLSFAVLLIAVLLTVSVNQRLGEIAALRALGFTRGRVAADVLAESLLIVGSGGLLSLPLGLALASGLDRILKRMPGIPEALHFFVFQERTLVIHLALLAATAVIAAIYPVRIVARLPIAATLRDEVIG